MGFNSPLPGSWPHGQWTVKCADWRPQCGYRRNAERRRTSVCGSTPTGRSQLTSIVRSFVDSGNSGIDKVRVTAMSHSRANELRSFLAM